MNLGRPDNGSSQPDDGRRDVEHVGADKLVKYTNTQIHNIQIVHQHKTHKSECTNTQV